MRLRILTFQSSFLSLPKLTKLSRIGFPRWAGSIILILRVGVACLMRKLIFAFRTMNINVFVPARCRLKWPPWSARRVSLDTCDKIRIRKCAKPNHPQASNNWLANPRNLKAETADSTSEVAAHGRPPNGIESTKAVGSTEQPDRPKAIDFNYV